jgi:hypothetical protein
MCLALITSDRSSRLRVRFNRIRFHAKARSREVKTLVYLGLAVLGKFTPADLWIAGLKGPQAETAEDPGNQAI